MTWESDFSAWRVARGYGPPSVGADEVVSAFVAECYEHMRAVANGEVGGATAQDITDAIATHAQASNPHAAYALTSDPRLSDARTPTAHNQAGETITTGTVAAARLPSFGSGAAGIVPASGGGTTNYLRADGTWTAPPAGGGPSTAKKTADQTFNSATPADVSGLAFALTSGRYYKFEFNLIVRSDTLTVGVATSLTFPAMTWFAANVRMTGFAVDGAGAEWQGNITTSDDAVVPTATVAINTDYLLTISGIAVPSASGNLQVRARTETGTTVVTVRQGSMGLIYDLGT